MSTLKRLRLGYIREDGRAFVYACGLPVCDLRRAADGAAGGREERAQRFGGRIMSFDYNAPRWRRLRASVLRRDGYLCRYCLRYGRRRQATTVHHIEHADEHPELAYAKNGDSFQIEAEKIAQLPYQRMIDAINFEFDLPLPSGRYGRAKDMLNALVKAGVLIWQGQERK